MVQHFQSSAAVYAFDGELRSFSDVSGFSISIEACGRIRKNDITLHAFLLVVQNIVCLPSPPVPTISTSGSGLFVITFVALFRIDWEKPAISVGVSPFIRNAIKKAPTPGQLFYRRSSVESILIYCCSDFGMHIRQKKIDMTLCV